MRFTGVQRRKTKLLAHIFPVDAKSAWFHSRPGMRRYLTAYASRTGDRSDGCLTFWRKERFTAREVHTVHMNEHGLRDNVALLVSISSLGYPVF